MKQVPYTLQRQKRREAGEAWHKAFEEAELRREALRLEREALREALRLKREAILEALTDLERDLGREVVPSI